MDERSTVLGDMVRIYQQTGASVVAFKSFPPEEISSYGCADPEPTDVDNLVLLKGIVEKPAPEDAPSDLAVMGRYLFTREIFDALDRTKPGVGGEIQLTDDYLRATVELALDREDLAPEFRAFLADVVRRRGIV
jgi:UTP--glucose-1-phosphate uridylyltransferase